MLRCNEMGITADEYNRQVLAGLLGKAPKPKAQRKRPAEPYEYKIQIACVNWFAAQYRRTYEAGLLIHIPNERHCTPRQGAVLRAMGLRKGAADIALFVPRGGYHALFVEMKRGKGRQKPEQVQWQQAVEAQGYRYVVCNSIETFAATINEYMRL